MTQPRILRLSHFLALVLALIALPATAQTFTPELTPEVVTVTAGDPTGATVHAAINHDPGFASSIRVYFSGMPAGVTISPAERFLDPPYAAVPFTVRAAAGTPAGTYNVLATYSSSTNKTANLTVNVLNAAPPPDYRLNANPQSVSIQQGGSAQTTISGSVMNAFTGMVTVSAGSAPGLTVSPASFQLTLPGPTFQQAVTISAAAAAPAGTVPLTFTGMSGTLVRTVTVNVEIRSAAPAADFSIAVAPLDPPAVMQGGTAKMRVSATGMHGFNAPIQLAIVTPAGITATPSALTMSAGETREIALAVAPAAAAGIANIVVNATSGTLQRTASATLQVMPAPVAGTRPVIDAVSPELARPTPAQAVYVIGRNFAPGAVVVSQMPGIVVEQTIVRSPALAEAMIAVRGDVAPGGYRLDVRNPDGAATLQGGTLVVRDRSDLGGPLGVTTAAIVYPVEGTIIAPEDDVYPRALLATTGTGTIVGYWALDGIRFDSFTASVAGGRLVSSVGRCPRAEGETAQVCTSVPLPPLTWGPAHRLELILETPRKLASPAVAVIGSPDSATGTRLYEPADGAEITTADPEFTWTLVPGATGYEIEFQSADTPERVVRFRSTSSQWTPTRKDLLRLGAGEFRWRVRAIRTGDVRDEPTAWRTVTIRAAAYTALAAVVAFGGDAAAMPVTQETPPQGGGTNAPPATHYTIAPNVIVSNASGQEASARAQVSLQGEKGSANVESKFTGDLSYGAGFDPQRMVQESRNWIIQAGTPLDRAGGDVRLGYTTPDFTDGAEYLTSGFARTGVIARARSRFGTFSYYQPVETAVHGVLSGNPENLEIRSLALATPEGRPYSIRLIGLEVEEPEETLLGVGGSRLRTVGLFGRYQISDAVAVVGELARGKVESLDGAVDSRDGLAFRVGLNGALRGVTYDVALRSVGANFVNPANRGLTPGGVADRVSLDVSLGRTIGRAALNLTVRRQEQGESDESTLPESDQTTWNLGLTTTLGRVAMNLSANLTSDRGEADEASFLPATHRDATGFSASFSEMFGAFNLSQSITYQRMEDDLSPLSDQEVFGVNASASGALGAMLTLSATLGGTRTEAAPELGTTDNLTLSIQPSVMLPIAALSLQPVISFSHSTNDVLQNDTKTEGYQAMLQWSPPWRNSLVGAQLSAGWNRITADGAPRGPLMRTYQGAVTIRLSATR